MFVYDAEHLCRREVFKTRPAQVNEVAAFAIQAFGKYAALYRLAETSGLVFFERVQIVKTAQKQQVSDLLHYLQRIGDTARPEGVPD
jgi:hypothetical protein